MPKWATTIVTAICGFTLVWIATSMKTDFNSLRDDVKTVREKIDIIAPAVAVHTSMFSSHEKTLIDLQRRIEKLEATK